MAVGGTVVGRWGRTDWFTGRFLSFLSAGLWGLYLLDIVEGLVQILSCFFAIDVAIHYSVLPVSIVVSVLYCLVFLLGKVQLLFVSVVLVVLWSLVMLLLHGLLFCLFFC